MYIVTVVGVLSLFPVPVSIVIVQIGAVLRAAYNTTDNKEWCQIFLNFFFRDSDPKRLFKDLCLLLKEP